MKIAAVQHLVDDPVDDKSQFLSLVREDTQVKRLLDRTEDLDAKLPAIVDELIDEGATRHNIAQATLKCLEAHNVIRVFISYNSAQAEAARALDKILKSQGAKQFEIFFADTSIEPGTEWEKQIYPKLWDAHWLFVLYPQREQELAWVVFEAGNFHGRRLPGDRMYCIHRPSELPFQGISKFQNTAAEEEKIFELLNQLLTQPKKVPGREAVNPDLDTEHLRQSCRKLTQLLEPRRAE
jgi:hypothetical protein